MDDEFNNDNGKILEFPREESSQEDSSIIRRIRCNGCHSVNFRILYTNVEGKILCSNCGKGKDDIRIFIQKNAK